MIKYLPAICFAIIPFGFWGQNIFFGHANTLMLSATLILFLCKYENNYELSGWIKSMGVYLSCWMAFTFLMVFLGKFPQILSMAMIEAVFFIFAGLILFLSIYRGSLSLSSWLNIICIAATAQALLAVSQTFGFDPVRLLLEKVVDVHGQMAFTTPVGTMGNQNFLAAFLAISLPFFFRATWVDLGKSRRKGSCCLLRLPIGWYLAIPIIVYALILTKTTTAIGAAIIGSVYFFFGWKWACGSVLPAFVIYAIKFNGTILTNARIQYWLDAINSTTSSWQTFMFGWGPGITWKSGNMLHSEYINAFFNYGLIGLIIMVGYIVSVHKMNKMLLSAFIVLCIDMIGNHALHTVPTAVLIITIIALLERQKQEDFIYARSKC